MKKIVVFFLFFALVIATSSCGKKAKNVKPDLLNANQEFNFLILERQCINGQNASLPIVNEIVNYYKDFKVRYPLAMLNIPKRDYNHESPLAVSARSINEEFSRIKDKIESAKVVGWELVTHVGMELHYLVQSSERFDGLKCSLPNMIQNKNQDLRPSLFFTSLCPSGVCSEDIFNNLSSANKEKIYKQAIKFVQLFL